MKKLLISTLALFILSSCAQTSNGVTSAIYTNWKDRDFVSRVDNDIPVSKMGKSCVTNVLGLAAFGDSSINAAKEEGGIKNVAYIDRTYEGFWLYIPFFQKGCTIVNGN